MLDTITAWLEDSGLRLLVIILVTVLVNQFGTMIVRAVVRQAIKADNFASERAERLREETVVSIVSAALRVAVWGLAVLVILSELNIEIGPLLAGAGVVGFAVGFGAQSLIKDFLAGLFIIIENQYRVGDVVSLNTVDGTVEHISMRTTVLRDLDGNVHHIPNGLIEIATNKTMEFARINLNIGVSYDTDIDKAHKVIDKVGDELAEDPIWGQHVKKAPKFARVNDFLDSSLELKIFGEVEPAKQWEVTGELRRRLKKAFDKEGIEIPFPQVDVHNKK